jgi:hypothetical protein
MIDWQRRQRRKDEVKGRAKRPNHMYSYCRVIRCGKRARAGTTEGLDTKFCRSHADQHQRHGSPYKKSYTAKEINPYRRAALEWILANEDDVWVKNAIAGVEGLYRQAGPHVEAFRLRGQNPRARAWAAWARLREADVDPRIPLAVWLAVEMVIADDPQGDWHTEFKQVQAAKIVHRLVSGSHKRWEREIPHPEWSSLPSKKIVEEMHVYPQSRGRVLRHIGKDLEEAAALLVDQRLDDVKAFKHEQEQSGVSGDRPYPKGVAARRRKGAVRG